MQSPIKALFILTMLYVTNASAGLYWVGSSANCTGSNVYGNLNQALFVAAFNGDSTDEIRLTNTVSYSGATHGNYTLTDWSSTGAGVLTVVGGYADCFAGVSGRTTVGNSPNPIFTVETSAQSSSIVTLRNLVITGGGARGVVATAGAALTLDNVDVSGNAGGGIEVSDGGVLTMEADSIVQLNGDYSALASGGGIRCTGNNSAVYVRGYLYGSSAQSGGNVYLGSGCYVELANGVRIEGLDRLDARDGGGVYVDSGGQLYAAGGANRVIINNHEATDGGGLYINGSGFALLENTHFDNNRSFDHGAAIYATGGGPSVAQLIMDRTDDCSFLFACSEIQNSRHGLSAIYADNSLIQIQRTVVELSAYTGTLNQTKGLITSTGGAVVRLNRVAIIRNEAYSMLGSIGSATIEASHLTIAGNTAEDGASVPFSVYDGGASTSLVVQNSIVTDTGGTDFRNQSLITGKCNLVDDAGNLSASGGGFQAGTFHLGTPDLINPAGGDARQLAGSLGVDMCLQDSFAWSTETDLQLQGAPVNESTNPQGMPGETNGLFDAGVDEVYDNIGDDEFLLTVLKDGTGSGVVISIPAGISCGGDCDEVFFKGTIVTLFASPAPGSTFVGWLNCPLSDDDECAANVQSPQTIRAVFALPDDLIFADGYE